MTDDPTPLHRSLNSAASSLSSFESRQPDPPPLSQLEQQLATERAIADGARNLLAVFSQEQEGEQRHEEEDKQQLKDQVQVELQGALGRIQELEARIRGLAETSQPPTSPSSFTPSNGIGEPLNSPNSFYSSYYQNHYRSDADGAASSSPLNSPVPQPPPTAFSDLSSASASAPEPFSPAEVEPEDSFATHLATTLAHFETLTSLSSAEGHQVLEKLRTLDSIVDLLIREIRLKYELRLVDLLPSIMPLLSFSPAEGSTHLRAGAYRVLRHLIVDQEDSRELMQGRYLDLFLVRSLALDHSSTLTERSQALRLIRLLLSLPPQSPQHDYPSSVQSASDREAIPATVPCSVIRAVVALAEAPPGASGGAGGAQGHGAAAGQDAAGEKLRMICLETLGELVISSPAMLLESRALPLLLSSLSDGPYDLSPLFGASLLALLDTPVGRQCLRVGVDVEGVLGVFTEVSSAGRGKEGAEGEGKVSAGQRERVCAARRVVEAWLKSWAGILYLNMNDKRALRSLVDSLTNPSTIIRETLLDLFFSVFQISTPTWYTPPSGTSSRTSAPDRRSGGAATAQTPSSQMDLGDAVPAHEKINLITQYLSVLLMMFIEAGLVETLVAVAADCKDTQTTRKVSLLLGDILQLANRVLPLAMAAHIQTLPKLFALTTSFDQSPGRLAASSALAAVDGLNRDEGRAGGAGGGRDRAGGSSGEDARARSNSLEDPLKRGQRQVESTKLLLGLSIDDAHFRNLLLETQVLSTKDHTKWNVEIMLELLEGPLLNPKRLDEAMRASKFMRRLCGFFHPFGYRYSEVRKSRHTAKYTQLGCTLLTTLLANPDGVRYLAEDKLLRQIADCLNQLDPLGGPPASEIVLSKQRMETTLTSGYFEMLGTLTKSVEGVRLLDHFKIFTSFYRISDLRSREDLVKAIIDHVDYVMDGHPRVFLSKALTSSYKHIRVYATQHLSHLLASSSSTDACAQEWQIRLLLTQIYDPSPEVCELAVKVLEKACGSLETLEIVVQMRPSLDHLGEMGTGLLTRFLSTSVGVRYLHQIGFIQRELDEWYDERNAIYVVQLELQLASALHTDQISSDSTPSPFDGTPPAHFYGELVKTDEGCEMLEDSGHFPEFADFIRKHAMEDNDPDIIAKLKSVLWAVGQVGASAGGIDFIDQEFILESIVDIAEESPIYSLRGTAYFVLGLIASTLEGVEMLEEFGWEGVLTPLGNATGLCVPMELAAFVYTPPWDPAEPVMPEALLLAAPSNHLEVEAVTALANLSNHILATKASKTLARLKQRHRELFSSPRLYYRALEMLANHHYRLSVRRYIIDLFDLPLDGEVAEQIMEAGEDLRLAGEKERDAAGDEFSWRRKDGAVPEKAVKVILGDEDFSDDEDEVSSVEDEGSTIPLQVLPPGLTIRGFLLV